MYTYIPTLQPSGPQQPTNQSLTPYQINVYTFVITVAVKNVNIHYKSAISNILTLSVPMTDETVIT